MREYIDRAHRLCLLAVVPHETNDFRPHLLRPHRTARYLVAFTAMKFIVFGLVALLPVSIFASSEAVQVQERELTQLVNAERAAVGVPPLAEDARLVRSAGEKSGDMIERQYFAHTNDDGEGPGYFASRVGYPYSIIGENLAMGFVSAKDIVDAWRQSPLHARNMQEPAFADTGLSVVGGTYGGAPTIFVTQHFGRQRQVAPTPSAAPIPTEVGTARVAVGGQKIIPPQRANKETTAHAMVQVQSASLAWSAHGNAQTTVTAKANIAGTVARAQVTVRGETIPLERAMGEESAYTGTATLPESPEKIFRVVVPATLSVTDSSGEGTVQDVLWEAPAIVLPSLVGRYAQAKKLLPETFGPIFSFSGTIFGIGFFVFAIAWLVNLLVEIRRQHLDLLVPGGALVLLLGWFWLV